MNSGFRSVGLSGLAVAVALGLLPLALSAADHAAKTPAADNPAEVVELFSAMEKGQVDVKLIPKDSTQCRVMIENKTDKPLSVKLPHAFAGVPVLAQAANPVRQRNNNNNNNMNQMNQGMGGGMGGMMGGMGGMGMGGGGMGMGMMNIAPEKVGQFKVTTVCLDHGKAEPRAAVPYTIKPIDSYTGKPGVAEICEMLGKGQLDQRAAQVAAWHLNNGMSFQQLAAKQLRFANGTTRPYFSPQELQAGMRAVNVASQLAKQRADSQPQTSLSQK